MTVRIMNLVTPLSHKDTDRHIADTAAQVADRSGAVPLLNIQQGDVDSANQRPSTRTSTTAIRTTTICLPSVESVPSADSSNYSFELLLRAYLDCRKHKRNTGSALAFEQNLERNLWKLHQELSGGTYAPGKSICFVITRPKAREVWAADFRDRIVHHLFYNQVSPRFHANFIVDSCACIPGRGTMYAGERLEAKIRSVTQNWSRPAFYLKCDLANFFVAIDKNILRAILAKRITAPFWLALADTILFHDPRQNFDYQGRVDLLQRVPAHKRLTNHPAHLGLPIGNLSSQFFANVYLNELDQFCKHQVRARHYIRYVDDFILLHDSPQWLNEAHRRIEEFLPDRLGAMLNPKKTILQPVDRGVDFVGHVVKPWSRTTRRRTFNEALRRVRTIDAADLFETANSYFGLLRQASTSHGDRVLLAKAVLQRGHSVNSSFTKAYRRTV